MKVLYINVVCGTGSTGRICTDLLACLEKMGHSGAVAYGRGGAPESVPAYRIETDAGVRLHALTARLFDSAGFGSKSATQKLIRWIVDERFDLIHLHNLHGYYIHVGLLFDFLKQAGLPAVWTLHDCWAMTGHCTHFDFVGCEKWRTGCFSCPEKRQYPASLLLDNSSRNHQQKKALFTGVRGLHLVSPSQWLADLIAQSNLKEYPVSVIPNGVDRSKFCPASEDVRQRLGLQGKRVYLSAAGHWYDRKGLYDLTNLARLLNTEEKLVVVGLSEKQRRDMPDNVLALGHTGSVQGLAALYTMADVFINPSREDNLPTVNLEALACGTRVITYPTGGSPETLPEGGGIVTAEKTPQALLEAARALGPKPADAPAFDVLSKEKAAQRYLSLYEAVLKGADK